MSITLPGVKINGIYSYGQPMVGDKRLADACEAAFGDLLFRHVYRNHVLCYAAPQ